VNIRRNLLVAVDRAKVAAQSAVVTTLQSVAQEIMTAASELVHVLPRSVRRSLRIVVCLLNPRER